VPQDHPPEAPDRPDDIFAAAVETDHVSLRRLRFKAVPVRVLIPNVVTLIALCAGLTSLRMALDGRLEMAVYCILAAAVLDGVDGRLARMLGGTSKFGAQLDSLADFVNFGVAPGFMLYVWSLHDLKSLGWMAALVFAIAAALRLARFNVALEDENLPAFTRDFFVGVPAPAGAMIVLLPVYSGQLGAPSFPHIGPVFTLIYCVLIGALMISRLPTWSPKKFGPKVRRDLIAPLFFGTVLAVALVASYPWEVLTFVSLMYLASLPLAWRRYKRLETLHKAESNLSTPVSV
jgi:CDP-diacylglycerol--serine O-phosphatidyltransferase